MKNVPLLIGTLLGTVVLVVVIALFFSNSAEPKKVDQAALLGNTKNARGPENAKVTVVEFSDFQCPSCQAVEPVVQELLTKHGNEVRFIYRHFPLVDIHKNAQQAALTGQAAATFNKFWEMHDLLFQTQKDWAELSSDQVKTKFLEYAEKLQIDKNEFEKRIETQEVHQQVTDDVADGMKVGINATPTFFVNGEQTTAPQLLSTVESLLQENK